MLCPNCNTDCAVINTRQKDYGRMRRYECPDCKKRFTTIETIDDGFSRGKPSERIKAEWIDKCVRAWSCSHCGMPLNHIRQFASFEKNELPNYCPHCGAKMEVTSDVL